MSQDWMEVQARTVVLVSRVLKDHEVSLEMMGPLGSQDHRDREEIVVLPVTLALMGRMEPQGRREKPDSQGLMVAQGGSASQGALERRVNQDSLDRRGLQEPLVTSASQGNVVNQAREEPTASMVSLERRAVRGRRVNLASLDQREMMGHRESLALWVKLVQLGQRVTLEVQGWTARLATPAGQERLGRLDFLG